MGHVLTIERAFRTDHHKLFLDFVDPRKIEHWFYEEDYWTAQAEVDLKIRGKYRIEMVTDIGNSFVHYGEFLEFNPTHTKLKFTWNSGVVENTIVDIEFRDLARGRSMIRIHHGMFENESTRDKHELIWNKCLDHLEKYIENPTPFPIYQDPDYNDSDELEEKRAS